MQYNAVSDTHVTSPHSRPSEVTFIDLANEPKPLALETKPTICGSEQAVALAKMHVVEFHVDALVNENRLLTRGTAYITCNAEVRECKRAIETDTVRSAPTPHAPLHCKED